MTPLLTLVSRIMQCRSASCEHNLIVVYEIKCILEEVLEETAELTDDIINIALPLHLSLLDNTLELVWKTTCNLDDILARYV